MLNASLVFLHTQEGEAVQAPVITHRATGAATLLPGPGPGQAGQTPAQWPALNPVGAENLIHLTRPGDTR